MPQTKLYTLEEFAQVPEFKHYELVAGEPRRRPMNTAAHGILGTRLVTALSNYVGANRLGITLMPDSAIVTRRNPDSARIPDVMFVSAASLGGFDVWNALAVPTADLVVEILSPSNSRREIGEKMAEYFAVGVREVWIVDPKRRTVTVQRPNGDSRTYIETDVLDGGEVVPGFRYPLAQLFVQPDFG